MLQYDSVRGLEGWSVCCMELEQMVKEKRKEYSGKSNPLLLQSKAYSIKKHIDNWLMIAMTRAIDTLIITLNDSLSNEGKVLKNIRRIWLLCSLDFGGRHEYRTNPKNGAAVS